jgi:hypothetical protein
MFLFARRELQFGPEAAITHFSVARTTFAVLDVAFASDCVAVTESGGPVRCLSLLTGTELWRHTPAPGVHSICLTFSASLDQFASLEWGYEAGGARRLMHLSKTSGTSSFITDLTKARDFSFSLSGSLLISSEGDVIEVASGKMIRRLEFPSEAFEEPEFPSWEQRIQTGTAEQRELARLLGPPDAG